MRIYLDNAATSWPKPEAVYRAVDDYQRNCGVAAGRSQYRLATDVQRQIQACRQRAAQLIGAKQSQNIVFTLNGTDSLNSAIHGILRPGDHVVTSVAEHNSILRPLSKLAAGKTIEVTFVDCDDRGIVQPAAIREALRPNTRLVALTHASNVTGAIQPIADIGEIARKSQAIFLVDAAQSLGHIPLDVNAMQIDLLAAPGHKGLLGPLGTGLLYVRPGLEDQLQTTRQGGTGTQSEDDSQPTTMPDKFESGNLNVPGIVGLQAALAWRNSENGDARLDLSRTLAEQLHAALRSIRGVSVFGPLAAADRLAVVSIAIDGYDPQEVAVMLDSSFEIQVRAGLHCAPRMHRRLGTLAGGGTVRFSPGHFSTAAEIETTVQAVSEIAGSSSP